MNSSCRIAALASFSFAIAGSATAAEPDRSENPWSHWYIGSGIGPGFGAKYKLNGRSFSFDDGLQGATDKSPLIALNVVNAGIALSPNLLFGFSGSAASQIGKLNGNDAQLQINNYFAALTWFPAEKGFFLRGGAPLRAARGDEGRALAHRLQERGAEFRAPLHQVQEHVAAHREQRAVGFRDSRGEPRRAIDERHFAEDAAGAHFFDHRIADADRDAAFEHREQRHAQVPFPHDDPSGFVAEARRRADHLREIGEQLRLERGGFPPPGVRRSGGARDRIAQAADHDAHQHEREPRGPAECGAKLRVVEADHPAVALRHRGGAARHLAHRGHLAENLAGPDGGDGLAFHDDADFPLQEQVDPVGHEQQRHALPVLGEDDRALRDRLRLARELEEIQRDGRIVERRAPGNAGTRRIQNSLLPEIGSGRDYAYGPRAGGRNEAAERAYCILRSALRAETAAFS